MIPQWYSRTLRQAMHAFRAKRGWASARPRYSSRAKAVRLTTPGRYPLASPCLEASALPEGECVRLGAGLVEGDLERSLADPVMLAYKLIQAAVPDHAVSVLVDVDTC